jgi:hypothetical protein
VSGITYDQELEELPHDRIGSLDNPLRRHRCQQRRQKPHKLARPPHAPTSLARYNKRRVKVLRADAIIVLPQDELTRHVPRDRHQRSAQVEDRLRLDKRIQPGPEPLDVPADGLLVRRDLGLGEERVQRLPAGLVDVVVCGEERGAVGREGVDGPGVLVPDAVLAVDCVVEGRVADVKLIGADPYDRPFLGECQSQMPILNLGARALPYCRCSSAILNVYWPFWITS